MSARYLIRIDDVCPTMNSENFSRLKDMLHRHDIKPIIGIIPENADPKLMTESPKETFWADMKSLGEKGWIIAQHGYRHEYLTSNGGILKINQKSEFAGLSYDVQKEKIAQGKRILEDHLGHSVSWWMAPAHSFDVITCQILKELQFKYITDGIALFPFKKYNLIWVPQQLWSPKKKLLGAWTICIHPDSIDKTALEKLEKFIQKNRNQFQLNTIPRETLLNDMYHYWWKFQYLIFKLIFK